MIIKFTFFFQEHCLRSSVQVKILSIHCGWEKLSEFARSKILDSSGRTSR